MSATSILSPMAAAVFIPTMRAVCDQTGPDQSVGSLAHPDALLAPKTFDRRHNVVERDCRTHAHHGASLSLRLLLASAGADSMRVAPPEEREATMPTRESYEQGTPSWVDLATTDLAAAKEFYAAVFGWDYDDQETPDGVGYSMALIDGKTVAGLSQMGPETAEQMPPMWNTYLAVDDLDAVVGEVPASGGQVMVPAMDVMEHGRMAYIVDPSGAAVGLWQARAHTGAQLVNEPNTLCWNECFTEHVESAAKFYDAVLGTTHATADMGNGQMYTTLMVRERQVAGLMRRDPEQHPQIPNAWTVYFATSDIDGAVATINEAGGSVMNGPFPTPPGPMLVAADPQGAVFQVIELQQGAGG